MTRLWLVLVVLLVAFVLLGWLVSGVMNQQQWQRVADQFHATLATQRGKIPDPGVFVRSRFVELVGLLTLATMILVINLGLIRTLRLFSKPGHWNWLMMALFWFAQWNLFVGVAAETVVFWLGPYRWKKASEHLAAFHIKRQLAEERTQGRCVVMVGNSQMNAALDEGLINRELGPQLWAVDLYYPAAQPFDFLLVQRQYRSLRPAYALVYISQMSLYAPVSGDRFPALLDFAGLVDFLHLGGFRFPAAEKIPYGTVGACLPAWRFREVLSDALFPLPTQLRKPSRPDRPDDRSSQDEAIAETASRYRLRNATEFHQRCLEEFVRRCGQSETQVVLLAGQMAPELERALDPQLRAEMIRFLQHLEAAYQHVVLLDDGPPQLTDDQDFTDLRHMSQSAQRKYTRSFLNKFQALLSPKTPSSPHQ